MRPFRPCTPEVLGRKQCFCVFQLSRCSAKLSCVASLNVLEMSMDHAEPPRNVDKQATDQAAVLPDLSDVQAAVLRPRPAPYRGQYILLRVGDAEQGREMVRRLIPQVAPADTWWQPTLPGWLGVAFTYSGLKALGLPQASLDSFPLEFQQGMAARADVLHDAGRNAPEHWEPPFGSPDVHVALAFYAKDDRDLHQMLALAGESHLDLPQVEVIYRLSFSELPGGRNPFGFRDGLHNPTIEGQGLAPESPQAASGPASNYQEKPLKNGEILLGYADELGVTAQSPVPEDLRRNGTFIAFRKFYADVARFRQYLRKNSGSPDEEELLAAKMVGRWRSGAPLVLAPEADNPALGMDQVANNAFGYSEDKRGLRCPMGAHLRRANPRDSLDDDAVDVNLHKFIRRGTNFGDPLPEGVLEDDGADRGGVFLFIGAHLDRQFEFVQSQWLSNGDFIGEGQEQDPILGNAEREGTFTIPKQPLRRRLQSLPQFVTVRGGEYCFMPGIGALQWIADVQKSREH